MARTVLQDVDRVLASAWYRAWVLLHPTDAKKIRLERAGSRRPIAGDSWARCFIEAIRVGLWVQPPPPPPPPPPPDPPPPPPAPRYAPRTYNLGSGNQDPRFCISGEHGVVRRPDGLYVDLEGALYDENGLNVDGRRDRNKIVSGLKPADEMDGRGACDPYNGMPPWPAGSYER